MAGTDVIEVNWKTGANKFILFGSAGTLDQEATTGKYVIAMVLHTTPEYLLDQETGEEDSELAFYRTQRAIARNARNWSTKQKTDLVNALFGEE